MSWARASTMGSETDFRGLTVLNGKPFEEKRCSNRSWRSSWLCWLLQNPRLNPTMRELFKVHGAVVEMMGDDMGDLDWLEYHRPAGRCR